MVNVSVAGVKRYMMAQDFLSLMLGVAQSSTTYVAAARFYQTLIQKPAQFIVDKVLPEDLMDAQRGINIVPTPTGANGLGLKPKVIMKSLAEFIIASGMIYLVAHLTKSSVKKLPFMVTVAPTGFYSSPTTGTAFDMFK